MFIQMAKWLLLCPPGVVKCTARALDQRELGYDTLHTGQSWNYYQTSLSQDFHVQIRQ